MRQRGKGSVTVQIHGVTFDLNRHSGLEPESRKARPWERMGHKDSWIPAFAGMTVSEWEHSSTGNFYPVPDSRMIFQRCGFSCC